MKFVQGIAESGIRFGAFFQMAHVDQTVVIVEVVRPTQLGHFVWIPPADLGNDVAQVERVILVQESPKPLLNPQELLP